jgi:15-cis-phytoene desaturase
MPVHIMRQRLPPAWADLPFFRNAFDNLKSVPVMNVQLWFDRKLPTDDSLIFSRSKLLSVYADMSTTTREARNDGRSMLEFVFAPATKASGAERDWIGEREEVIVEAVMGELEALFPQDFGPSAASPAKLVKSSVVKTPQSIYLMAAGMQRHRPTQATPIDNFFLAGDYTSQRYLASMEGAILSGKQVTEVIVAKDEGRAARDVTSTPGTMPPSIKCKQLS